VAGNLLINKPYS